MGSVTYDYSDSTVVVTGGSSGIGREIAVRFAEAGAAVLNGDIRREAKDRAVPTDELIRDRGGKAEFVETDVADPDDISDLIALAREFGGVDVFVNNAGVWSNGPLREVTPEEFERLHDVNVKGMFFGVQAAANDMLERDDPGVILNTASISSNSAQHGQMLYDSTKGAIQMITRGSALELADTGIRVNGVAPGQIATEISEGWSEAAHEVVEAEETLKPVPLGRAGKPADVAGAYLFLASDDARYVTGELLHVDGGWQIC